MQFFLRSLLVLIICGAYSLRAEETWSKVSIGKYVGYSDQFAVVGDRFILNGDTGFGSECEFVVTKDGVELVGELLSWDAPGVQASRTVDGKFQRINFMARYGAVVVADLSFEDPKGKVVLVTRMSVALAPNKKTGEP